MKFDWLKLDSIKSRLMLITSVCVVGMLMMMFNQLHYTNRLLELHDEKDVVREMSNDLLQLRRHEKDFLLRKDFDYVTRFELTNRELLAKLKHVDALFQTTENAHTQFESVTERLNEYALLFNQLVDLQEKIGVNPQVGLLAKLEDSYSAIQQQMSRSDEVALLVRLAELKISEKNILLQTDENSVVQQSQSYALLVSATNQIDPSLRNALFPLLENYQSNLFGLVAALQQMGFTHEQGLRGEFRTKAHEVEDQLGIYISELLPQIAAEEQEVKQNSLLIMAVTAIALILLLVKSFATFHNAFANFVMFFYRCKREYQRLDERKFGFSEFKSLAALANEMVDAKKRTELKLKQMEQQVDQLKSEMSARQSSADA